MLTNGNKKLGTGIWNFNLPRDTCFEFRSKLCEKYCYAKRDNFTNPWVVESMERNYKQSVRSCFAALVHGQIIKNDIRFIRLHSSGDFYNLEYFDKWKTIAEMHSDLKVLAYTRNTEIDLRRLPRNMVVYFSKEFDYEYRGEKPLVNPTAKLFAYSTHWERTPRHMEKHPIDGRFCNSKCYKCKHCFDAGGHIVFVINIMCRGRMKRENELQLNLF